MDKNIKLSEELLKLDNIDPSNIPESERAMFKAMLDKEMKLHNKLSWYSTSFMWIFALAMIGLCISEEILQKLHIPFVAAWAVLIIGVYVAVFLFLPKHYKQIKRSSEKVQRLHFLTFGKYKGFPLVGKKDGKRYIDWLSIMLLAAAIWFVMSLGSAGVYFLLCRRWIFSSESGAVFHIFFLSIMSFTFVAGMIYRGLKAPLEKLTEIKPEYYTCSRRNFSFITLVVIVAAILVGIHFLGGSIHGTSVVWGRVLSEMDKFPTIIYTSVTETISDGNRPTISKIYNAGENGYRVDIFIENHLFFQMYEIPKENSYYSINHDQKQYFRIKLGDQVLPEDIPRPKPQERVKDILSVDHTNIGKSEINGIRVEGIEARNTVLMAGEDTIIKLWVDVKTNLPVKIEYEATIFEEPQKVYTRIRTVYENFQWNVELDPGSFEPNIPPDYKLDERY